MEAAPYEFAPRNLFELILQMLSDKKINVTNVSVKVLSRQLHVNITAYVVFARYKFIEYFN